MEQRMFTAIRRLSTFMMIDYVLVKSECKNYFEKLKAVAEVIWAKDPTIILIVGDFSYHKVITDPFNFAGADGGITTLTGHQKILQLAKQHDREAWFDVHVWTDGPRPDGTLESMFSYIDAM